MSLRVYLVCYFEIGTLVTTPGLCHLKCVEVHVLVPIWTFVTTLKYMQYIRIEALGKWSYLAVVSLQDSPSFSQKMPRKLWIEWLLVDKQWWFDRQGGYPLVAKEKWSLWVPISPEKNVGLWRYCRLKIWWRRDFA